MVVKDPFKKGNSFPAKKYKKALFLIDYKVYPFNLLVSVNQTKKELADSLVRSFKQGTPEEYINGPLAGDYAARTLGFEGGGYIIHFPNLDECSECFGTIAHEVFHAVELLFDRIDIPHSRGVSSEAYAYLIGYITSEIHKNLTIRV